MTVQDGPDSPAGPTADAQFWQPSAAGVVQNVRPLKVCIVSNGLVGPVRNGGISTHLLGLAETLVDSGHDVTYLYTGGTWTESEPVHVWVKRYRRRRLHVVPLPEPELSIDNSPILRIAYQTYE